MLRSNVRCSDVTCRDCNHEYFHFSLFCSIVLSPRVTKTNLLDYTLNNMHLGSRPQLSRQSMLRSIIGFCLYIRRYSTSERPFFRYFSSTLDSLRGQQERFPPYEVSIVPACSGLQSLRPSIPRSEAWLSTITYQAWPQNSTCLSYSLCFL